MKEFLFDDYQRLENDARKDIQSDPNDLHSTTKLLSFFRLFESICAENYSLKDSRREIADKEYQYHQMKNMFGDIPSLKRDLDYINHLKNNYDRKLQHFYYTLHQCMTSIDAKLIIDNIDYLLQKGGFTNGMD